MAPSIDLAERLATVVETQVAIATIRLDRDAVMKLVVNRARKLTNADGAVVEMIREEEIHYHTATGSLESHVGTLFDIEGSISGLCIETKQVLHTDDSEKDDRVNQEISRETGSRSIIVVPLIHEDEAVGVLKVVSRNPKAFSDLDRYSLQLMGGLIAAAMSHAAEYKSKIESEKRFRTLFERNLAGAFVSTAEGEILESNDAAAEILGFESREELMAQESWGLYPERRDREKYLETLREQGSVTKHQMTMRRKDGSFLDAIFNVDFIKDDGTQLLLGTFVPKNHLED